MRFVAAGLALFAVSVGVAFLAPHLASAWRLPRLPARLPRAWIEAAGEPTAWIFTRSGCPHCSAHLQALDRCLSELAPHERTGVLRRLRVVGDAACLSRPIELRPAAWRDSVRVRVLPTTLWVDAEGRVRDVWLGARGSAAWRRALVPWSAATAGGR